MRRKILLPLTAGVMIITMASCSTTGTKESGIPTVPVIEVQTSDWSKPGVDIPPFAIIQPEDLVISPVIDIRTLKAETDAETAAVRSSTLIQEAKKEEIRAELERDPSASTELDENYSDTILSDGVKKEGAKTSGEIASKATDDSFIYINSADAFTGAIAEYDYLEGMIYEVITSPNAITDIRLKPGENIASSPIVNNGGTSWQFTMGTSIENGISVQHLFVKPSAVGLDTSMILLTDQRTYYFRIASFPKSYMTALRFRYPASTGEGYYVKEDFDEFIENNKVNQAISGDAFSIDLTKAEYRYTIRVTKGKPSWTPQQVFSNETKTYIQFPISIMTSMDMPSVYILRDSEENLVNYRIAGNIYQLDTVLTSNEAIILKSGQKEQVKITRAK